MHVSLYLLLIITQITCSEATIMPTLPEYIDEQHGFSVVSQLQSLRMEGLLTDVILQIESQKFPCHRNVLAACSPYFRIMFTGSMSESRQTVVELRDLEPWTLRFVLDFMYSGRILLDEDNVQDVFMAANLLQVPSLIRFCADYLAKSLTISNCIGIYSIALAYNCKRLIDDAFDFINYNFVAVFKQGEFEEASYDVVERLIKSEYLIVPREGHVFQAIHTWYMNDPKNKREDAAQLVKHVDLTLLDDVLDAKIFEDAVMEGWAQAPLPKLSSESDDGDADVETPKQTRLGISAQELLILAGRGTRQNYLQGLNVRTKECYLLELPNVCRIFGVISTVVDNQIYCIVNDYQNTTLYNYNHIRNTWMEAAECLKGRQDFQMQSLNHKVYVVAGMDDWQILKTMECYDPATDSWSEVAPMPTEVLECVTAVYGDFLFVFSGSKTMRYNAITNDWITGLASMPSPRLHPACVGLGDGVWVVGGVSSYATTDRPSVEVEKYIPETNKWEKHKNIHHLLKNCVVSGYQEELYITGAFVGIGEVDTSLAAQLRPPLRFYHYNVNTDECVEPDLKLFIEDIITPCGTATFFTKNLRQDIFLYPKGPIVYEDLEQRSISKDSKIKK